MQYRDLLREINAYEHTYKKWQERGDKVVKRYKGEDTRRGDSTFNILWSNVETLIPAVFARVPQPEVVRRFKDRDPVARVASTILERCLDYEVHHYDDYEEAVTNSLKDRFLPGRGVSWVRYEPVFNQVQISEDAEEGESVDTIEYECAPVDYVHWKDFGHQCGRSWEEVNIVWRKVYMTEAELAKRFGDALAKTIPLDQQKDETSKNENERTVSKATVYECWCKADKTVRWLTKTHEKYLDEKPDPLGLDEFWPCPKPLFATLTTDSLVPVPDFAIYQDQADELDVISRRIDGLVRALKVVGVYDASQIALRRMLEEGVGNELIPVDKWSVFSEKGGIKGSVDFMPLDDAVKALLALYNARDQVKAQIYELTGISDIIRGQSQASETATAQEIKGRFATLRLKKMQEDVIRFATDLLKIKGQIVCRHFQPQTIMQMAAVEQMGEPPEMVMQAMQLLKTEGTRGFRIGITSDSMTQTDDEAEKASRLEFLSVSTQFLEKAAGAAQAIPQLAPLMGEMLMFTVRGFKAGKSMEGAFESAMQALAQPQERPDPNAAAMQAEQMKMQAQMQMEQQKLAMEQERAARDFEIAQAKLQSDMQAEAARIQAQKEIELIKQEAETIRQAKKAEVDASIKLELADRDAQARAMEYEAGERQREADYVEKEEIKGLFEKQANMHAESLQKVAEVLENVAAAMSKKRKRVLQRDQNGRAVGVIEMDEDE